MSNSDIIDNFGRYEFPHALLLSASAGSGKTYTLSQRYVLFLLSDEILKKSFLNGSKKLIKSYDVNSSAKDIVNILAVTFTNNAAKEMKEKVFRHLKELALGKSTFLNEVAEYLNCSKEEVKLLAEKHIDNILNNFHDFHIQTIDSFISDVFRMSAYELGYAGDSETKFSYKQKVSSAVSSVLSLAGTEEFSEEEVDNFLKQLIGSTSFIWNPESDIKEIFLKILEKESGTPFYINFERNNLQACIDKIIKSVQDAENPKIKELLDNVWLGDKINSGYYSNINFKVLEKLIKHLPEEAKELKEEYFLAKSVGYFSTYDRLYRKFREELLHIKYKTSGAIVLSDMSKELAAYINNDTVPEVYYNLGNRINHFLIDEFQDTSLLQWNILRPLIEEALSKCGSLFMVGDIKQAIYMFRNADYKIMRRLLKSAAEKEECGDLLDLSSLGDNGITYKYLPNNYRSDEVILQYNEIVFKQNLKALLAEFGKEDVTQLASYVQSPLTANKNKGYVKCLNVSCESANKRSEAYGEDLVKIVKDVCERYSEENVAILVKDNKTVEEVVEILSHEGIQCASYSSLDIRRRKVISEVLSFLKFLHSPNDSVSFLNFVTGEIFSRITGLEKNKLLSYVENISKSKKELSYADYKKDEVCGKFWQDYIDDIFAKSDYVPLYELLMLIYSSFKLYNKFPEEQAALAKLSETVISFVSDGNSTIENYLAYAAKDSEHEEDAKFSVDLPKFLKSVKVMTYHKSKGLGFDVVVNLIWDKKSNNSNHFYYQVEGDSLFPYNIMADDAKQSKTLNDIKEKEKLDEMLQKLNELYVICTRAKHELYNIVVTIIAKTDDSKNAGKKKKEDNHSAEEFAKNVYGIFENYEAGEKSSITKEQTIENYPVKISSRASCKLDIRSEGVKIDIDKSKRVIGQIMHEAVSMYNPSDNKLNNVRELLKQCALDYNIDFNQEKYTEMLLSFINSAFGHFVFDNIAGREVLSEKEFIDENGNLLKPDKVIIDTENITVVDFKTGKENEGYEKQIKNYINIVKQVYKKPCCGKIAYINTCTVKDID